MVTRRPDPGELDPVFTGKANPTAINNTNSVDALALTSSETRYSRATLKAMKPGGNALTKPTDNTGNVWICSGAEVLTGAFQLIPGASLELPPYGDLADYFLAVDTADDGVLIIYVNEER